jgi:hypothetical protein
MRFLQHRWDIDAAGGLDRHADDQAEAGQGVGRFGSRGAPGPATAVTAPNSRAALATAAGIVWSTRSSGTGVAGGGARKMARG